MAMIRAFIALPLPPSIQQEFGVIQKSLKDSGAEVKWDTQDKFHVTLKFLGDIDAAKVDPIALALKNSIGGIASFDLAFQTIGAFPNANRPRVIWIGGEENEHVRGIQRAVERECDSFGFAKDDRPFHTHVTLGRVKSDRAVERLTAKLKSITFKPLIARCIEVHIVRSELKPAGSVYTLLNSIPLAS
jgi:RNA 2',3'-cyclic 3'-phosphodiesterase